MAVYHQIGHNSENLLLEGGLSAFRGAILSPVNYNEANTALQVLSTRDLAGFDSIFDPQLYYPRTERGCLRDWSYFPSDVDTADLSSINWWNKLTSEVIACAARIGSTSICSPAVVPKAFSNDYYAMQVAVGNLLVDGTSGTAISAIQTAVVGLNELAIPGRAFAIASILSRTRAERVYLVLLGSTEPRRELGDVEEITGAMRLIAALSGVGLRVLVGFCSSDLVLWKYAGAADCASGKFFNLRRFTPARFEEPAGGGGQLPYWVEESLFAFLRESDLIRVRRARLLSDSSIRNSFGQEILAQLDSAPGTPWLARSWRQYLWWFADLEHRLTLDPSIANLLLREADEAWGRIENIILMEERSNSGAWLRSWRRACLEYATVT